MLDAVASPRFVETDGRVMLSAPWACGPPNVMNITEYANLLNLRGVCRDVRESEAKHPAFVNERNSGILRRLRSSE
jgi:hypothetical protein